MRVAACRRPARRPSASCRCAAVSDEDRRMKIAGRSFAVLLLVALGACSSQKPAPVVDRSGALGAARPPVVAGKPAAAPRETKDGVYTVQRGDTLYSIAMAFGVDVRELARWNGLQDASVLRVGQTVR